MRIDSIKMEKLSQKALERKSNKPIMEKKRRARINQCLNQLKSLILETDNERSRHSKLEKADILEMTVKYLQTLRAYHVHLQQVHQLQQQTTNQLHHFQQQQQQQSPNGKLNNNTSCNNNLAHQANLANSAPLSPALSPQQLNLQMPLPLSLQLSAHNTSPTTQLHHHLQNHHHLQHHRHHLGLAAAHTAQQISPTAWRPW